MPLITGSVGREPGGQPAAAHRHRRAGQWAPHPPGTPRAALPSASACRKTNAAYPETSGVEAVQAPRRSQFFVSVTHLRGAGGSVGAAGGGPIPQVGGSTMPRPASRNFAFEPEQIRVMHRAFGAVCARLQLSVGSGDRVTELVGRKIIELARAGEHDGDTLAPRVLAEFGIENDGSLWRTNGVRRRRPCRPMVLRPAPCRVPQRSRL
jgi:hypothetical protein